MSRAGKVLVTFKVRGAGEGPWFEPLRRAGFEVAFNRLGRRFEPDEMIEAARGCYATIAGNEPYDERTFAALPGLAVIARWGVGYDSIDLAAATRHGVAVAMAFGANHEPVADHAFALMAGLAADLLPTHRRVARGGWRGGFRASLWRATIGIVGLGRIGRAVARRARAFEMRVLANDIAPEALAYGAQHGIRMVDLATLLAESDVVTLHVPQTELTRRMIDAERLALMKPTAHLVNTARGGIVDEDALAAALRARRIAGAGLDVFRREPPVGSPLIGLENVLLTPHAATLNERCHEMVADRCVRSILAIARGEDPGGGCVVNPEVLAARAGAAPAP